ncbi:MAG: endonuclease [Sphingomonadales bacterium]|nr:endonuclease [Sphingomonadales bacterium]
MAETMNSARKLCASIFAIGLSLSAGVASAKQAAIAPGIERFKADSTLPLLKAALIPAGSEFLYVSGQIASPIDPSKPMSSKLTAADLGNTTVQTVSALSKVKGILEAHGYMMSDVVKLTVFLAGDPTIGGKIDFAGMNEGFKKFFGTAENPNRTTRSTVQVAEVAYPGFFVEIDVVAAKASASARK